MIIGYGGADMMMVSEEARGRSLQRDAAAVRRTVYVTRWPS